MSISVTFDESNWLVLPSAFPTEEAATVDEWLDLVVSRMRPAWSGGLDAETEEAVREELRDGLGAVRPEDSITLQYWRWSTPIAAVVHIVLGRFDDDDDDRPAYLLDDARLSADPAFEIVTAEHLGEGVEVRILSRPEGIEGDIAGLTQLYVSGDLFVAVGVDATLPALLALLLADLRELLDTATVADDEESAGWTRAQVSEDVLPSRGETWSAPRDAAESASLA